MAYTNTLDQEIEKIMNMDMIHEMDWDVQTIEKKTKLLIFSIMIRIISIDPLVNLVQEYLSIEWKLYVLQIEKLRKNETLFIIYPVHLNYQHSWGILQFLLETCVIIPLRTRSGQFSYAPLRRIFNEKTIWYQAHRIMDLNPLLLPGVVTPSKRIYDLVF